MIRHLGSSLTDVTYVFDEPSIGLHPHDIHRMNELLLQLRDKGNTVLVVEHKPEMIAIADHVVDLGPGAGSAGGEVVFEGTFGELRKSGTLTGTPSGALRVRGADTHNLHSVDVDIPLGVLVVLTGVAGSGKSSLIDGSVACLDGVVSVDQAPIRGSRRSNPATYTGLPMMAGVATTCEVCEGKRFDRPRSSGKGQTFWPSTGRPPACTSRTSSSCWPCSTGSSTRASR
jgi:excinuclease UvrABC ATPase subunit